jgi:hypothetical protein
VLERRAGAAASGRATWCRHRAQPLACGGATGCVNAGRRIQPHAGEAAFPQRASPVALKAWSLKRVTRIACTAADLDWWHCALWRAPFGMQPVAGLQKVTGGQQLRAVPNRLCVQCAASGRGRSGRRGGLRYCAPRASLLAAAKLGRLPRARLGPTTTTCAVVAWGRAGGSRGTRSQVAAASAP